VFRHMNFYVDSKSAWRAGSTIKSNTLEPWLPFRMIKCDLFPNYFRFLMIISFIKIVGIMKWTRFSI
jgi:hypothetical protein